MCRKTTSNDHDNDLRKLPPTGAKGHKMETFSIIYYKNKKIAPH